MGVAAILLASGYGRRYGSNKLLDTWEGVPLYRRALEVLPLDRLDRAVVVSQYGEVLAEAGRLGCLPVLNCHPWEGISASIRLGLLAAKDSDGALFAVCDQPRLTTESILRLLDSFEKSPEAIHALSWQGRRGNPVVFPRALYPELLALTGDTGGSAVLRRHPERLRLVEAASPGELEDVDRPEDRKP